MYIVYVHTCHIADCWLHSIQKHHSYALSFAVVFFALLSTRDCHNLSRIFTHRYSSIFISTRDCHNLTRISTHRYSSLCCICSSPDPSPAVSVLLTKRRLEDPLQLQPAPRDQVEEAAGVNRNQNASETKKRNGWFEQFFFRTDFTHFVRVHAQAER